MKKIIFYTTLCFFSCSKQNFPDSQTVSTEKNQTVHAEESKKQETLSKESTKEAALKNVEVSSNENPKTLTGDSVQILIKDYMVINIDQKNFPESKGKYLVADYDFINKSTDTIRMCRLDSKAYNDTYHPAYIFEKTNATIYQHDFKGIPKGKQHAKTQSDKDEFLLIQEEPQDRGKIRLRDRNIKTIAPGQKEKMVYSRKLEEITSDSIQVFIQIHYDSESIDRAAALSELAEYKNELETRREPFADLKLSGNQLYYYEKDCKKAMRDGLSTEKYCQEVMDYQNYHRNIRDRMQHLILLNQLDPIKVSSNSISVTVENK